MRNRLIILFFCSLLICGAIVLAGDCEKCIVVQIDTCAQNSGMPPSCDACAGLFMPCWDKSCLFKNEDCQGPAPGSCTKTQISQEIGLKRECVRGEVSWVVCLGQPRCDDEGVTVKLGAEGRYSC